jgi:pimeloyl-ACP methyl ester carboxylesterase
MRNNTTVHHPNEHRLAKVIDLPDAGAESDRSVLLINCPSGSSLMWNRVEPMLRKHHLRVLALDQPDREHDDSSARDYVYDAAAFEAQLDSRADGPVVVVGHSLGASTALTLAATAPRHVRALVLLAPAEQPAAITTTDRLLASRIIGPCLSWFGFRTAGLMLHLPHLRRRLLDERAGLSVSDAKGVVHLATRGSVWRAFTTQQRQLVEEASRVQRQLRELDCPVVIVAGQRDRIADQHVVAELAARLPEPIVVTTDTGHFIPLDDPGIVVDAILRALRTEYRQSLSRRQVRVARSIERRTS